MYWEYRMEKIKMHKAFFTLGGLLKDEKETEQILNDLGSQGWELVELLPIAQGYGATRSIYAIFKRQK